MHIIGTILLGRHPRFLFEELAEEREVGEMKAICYFFNRVLRMEQPVLDFFNRPVCNPGSGSLSAHLFHGSGQILGSDAHLDA